MASSESNGQLASFRLIWLNPAMSLRRLVELLHTAILNLAFAATALVPELAGAADVVPKINITGHFSKADKRACVKETSSTPSYEIQTWREISADAKAYLRE